MIRSVRARLAPILFLFVVAGCAAWVQPVETAQTVEQKAFAVYGEYAIAAQKAANVAEDAATPKSVRVAIRDSLQLTAPAAKSLRDAAVAAAEARLAIEAANLKGGADASLLAKMDIATGVLQRLYDKTRPQIEAFKSKVDSL